MREHRLQIGASLAWTTLEQLNDLGGIGLHEVRVGVREGGLKLSG